MSIVTSLTGNEKVNCIWRRHKNKNIEWRKLYQNLLGKEKLVSVLAATNKNSRHDEIIQVVSLLLIQRNCELSKNLKILWVLS